MRAILMTVAAVLACGILGGCGSVVIGEAQEVTSDNVAEEQNTEANFDVDCDALMQQLADNCFSVMAFEEDGTTPLHMSDDEGNDLGEVDQAWAAAYCECYAQLAFQTFGCSTVVSHEELDNEQYSSTYAPIVSACSSPETSENADAADAAPTEAAADAAPAEAAADAAPAEAAPASAE